MNGKKNRAFKNFSCEKNLQLVKPASKNVQMFADVFQNSGVFTQSIANSCTLKKNSHEKIRFTHGRIIKWTYHIGFFILAGMDPVIEGNHRKNSETRVARILCLSSLAKFDYSFYFYERKTKHMRAYIIV